MYNRLRKNKGLKVTSRDLHYINWKKPRLIILIFFLLLIPAIQQVYGCAAAFSVDNTTPVVNENVVFTDASTGGANSWTWNFGTNAVPATASTKGPHTVYYTTTGYKTVTLHACSGLGCDDENKTNYINVGLPPTPGAIGTDQTICNGATPAALTSTTAGGGSGTITYQWQTNASGSYVTISGATSAGYQPPALTATTSYQRRTVAVYGKTRYSGYTTPVTITVRNIFNAGAIQTTGQTVCSYGDPGVIGSATDASGGVGTITYQWQSSLNAGFSSPATISSNTSTYDPPANFTVNTWYRRQSKDGICNTTFTSSSGVWAVTVGAVQALVSKTDITCNGANNATITVEASGGVPPYSFSLDEATWVTEPIPVVSHQFTGLGPNIPYRVRVRDVNGCLSE